MSEVDATKPTEAAAPQVEDKPTETPVEVGKTEEAKSEENKAEPESDAKKDESEGKPNILKTTAKHDKDDRKNNNKFDPNTREVTDDPVAIRKQVCIPRDASAS